MKNEYRGIDLFKIIAAYLIILLHVPIFSPGTVFYIAVREIITIVAVPFFFTASGFILSSKLKNRDDKLIPSYVKNNYKKYLIWSIIYLPVVILGWIMSDTGIVYDISYYIRDFIFEGSYLTIWFLNALAFALLLEHILLRLLSPKNVFIVSIPFFVMACLLSSYNGLLSEFEAGKGITDVYYSIFATTKNGVFFGFPFVALGCYMYSVDAEKIDTKKSAIGMGVSFVLLIAEVVLRNHFLSGIRSVDFALMLIPFAAFALQLARTVRLKECSFAKTGESKYLYLRKLSVLLFLTQRIFIFFFSKLDAVIYRIISVRVISAVPFVHFVLVAGATTLFSMLIIKLSNKRTWLKKLY